MQFTKRHAKCLTHREIRLHENGVEGISNDTINHQNQPTTPARSFEKLGTTLEISYDREVGIVLKLRNQNVAGEYKTCVPKFCIAIEPALKQ